MESQIAFQGVERLSILVPIGVIDFELVAVLQEPGPAVRLTAPGAYDLRLIAIVETAAATGTCIHKFLLSLSCDG